MLGLQVAQFLTLSTKINRSILGYSQLENIPAAVV